ncbi:MAG: hypothetical protein K2G12_01600 [Prevotella sp.]|nr:hypothetical protein [Prevotella sp.]
MFCFIIIALLATAWSFAKEEQKVTNPAQQGYYCTRCDVQLRQMLVKVGERTCRACKGKGWYGYGRTKEECRKNGTLSDPCNYCGGRGVAEIKEYRWVCPRCQGRFNVR